MGQGESLATFTDSFVQRQGSCREASDGKHWQTNPWRRWRNLENARTESRSYPIAHPTRIPSAPITTSVHPQEQWRATSPLDSDMGCTLPFFPGDVRNSMGSPPCGSEFPIHRHTITLSQLTQYYEYLGASTAV